MFDFSKFESNNNQSESTFKEQFTVEEVREACGGAEFRVIPCKDKPGMWFFACGRVRGYVAKALGAKLDEAHRKHVKPEMGTPVVSHVVSDTFDGLMLHEQSTGNAIAVW